MPYYAILAHPLQQPSKGNIMNIQIRKEAVRDAAAIESVTVAAFLNAPHTGHTEQFIVNALRNSGH